MNVKEAVKLAKDYIADLYEDENILHLGLEEVEFDDDGDWRVTIGFSRAWDLEKTDFENNLLKAVGAPIGRSYKVVRIKDRDGRVISVTTHPVEVS